MEQIKQQTERREEKRMVMGECRARQQTEFAEMKLPYNIYCSIRMVYVCFGGHPTLVTDRAMYNIYIYSATALLLLRGGAKFMRAYR